MSRGPFRDVEFISTTRRAQLACTSEPLFVPSAHALAYPPDYPSAKQNNNIAKGGMGGFSKHLGAQASSCGAMNAHAFQRQGRSRELQNGRRLGNFRYHSFRNDACMLSLSQGVPASSQGVYPFVLPIMCSFWRGFTGLWLLPGSIALTALCALGCSWLSPPLASLASSSGFWRAYRH